MDCARDSSGILLMKLEFTLCWYYHQQNNGLRKGQQRHPLNEIGIYSLLVLSPTKQWIAQGTAAASSQ
jgi:hypothetical protein